MNFKDRIMKANKRKAYFILLYGVAGIGKTTFAAQAPDPIFIDLEGGLNDLEESSIDMMPQPESFTELMAQIEELISDPSYAYQTLVIDSLTRLEPMVWDEVCKEGKKASITKFGYGEGYKLSNIKWKLLIDKLQHLRTLRGWNIILTAHPETKEVPDPLQLHDYSRWQPRLHKDAMNMFIEASAATLFAEEETFVKYDEETDKAKAITENKRFLRTIFQANVIAKNRYGLPAKIDLRWESFDDAAKIGDPNSAKSIRSRIEGLLTQITDTTLVNKVIKEVDKVKTDAKRLADYEIRLTAIVKAQSA